MSDEQKIEGVPEGFRLVHAARKARSGEFYLDHTGSVQQFPYGHTDSTLYLFPILERIPKPKRKVLIVELDLGPRVIPLSAGMRIGVCWPGSRDVDCQAYSTSQWHIEERDVEE